MHHVIMVEPHPDMTLTIRFADGATKRFDMRPFIGDGISAALMDWNYFKQVAIEGGGGIAWPNGYDFCPEFLRDSVEEIHSTSFATPA
jgi:hypothetical protein